MIISAIVTTQHSILMTILIISYQVVSYNYVNKCEHC